MDREIFFMKKKIDTLLTLVIIVVLLPLFVTIICQRMQLEQVIYGEFETECTKQQASEDIEAQVVGIAAKEIGAGAGEQAILAQCVIARTNLYDALAHHTDEPAGLTIDEMQTLWGEDFETIYQRFEECVAQTRDEVLMWNGDYIYAAYHAISAGRTRDMTELSEEIKMPYLTEQECLSDTTAEGYLAVTYCTKEDFLKMCQENFPEAGISDLLQIEVQSRDAAGYVGEIKAGNETYLGEEFRTRLGWNSACFTITEIDGKVRVVTKGLGHGFGLSQNEAAHMAEEGESYQEILEYFFPGAELTTAGTEK